MDVHLHPLLSFAMPHANTVLRQLLEFIPKSQFQSLVGQHNGDKYVKKLTCWQQFIILLYAQATEKLSLRDIETGMGVFRDSMWYHLGIQTVARNTLAVANRDRPYQIYESLFHCLLTQCQNYLYGTASKLPFDNDLYALDSTTIDLCLNLFPWARFRKQKGAIKMHTLFDVRTQVPTVINVSDGKQSDIKVAKAMKECTTLAAGSILTIDRAYIDYGWLHDLHEADITFVVRLKKNANIVRLPHCSPLEKNVLKDEHIAFMLPDAQKDYPDDLRLVTYYDEQTKKTYEFLTNNWECSGKTIADIYQQRWQIELFFKWIKQHLKIKTFLGTSKNAVLTQIWIAMIYYLILTWVWYQTQHKSLLELTRIVQETLMQRAPLLNFIRLKPEKLKEVLARDGPLKQLALC